MAHQDLHKLRPFQSVMQNSLWNHDYHPELPDLEPMSTLEIGRFGVSPQDRASTSRVTNSLITHDSSLK